MNTLEILQYHEILNQIATLAHFSLSKQALMDLKPSNSKLWIIRENNRVTQAMDLDRLYGDLPMAGISDISLALIEAKKDMILSFEDLVSVSRFGFGVLSIQSYFKNVDLKMDAIEDLSSGLSINVDLSKRIERCFSPSLEILDDASSQLKSIRRQLRLKIADREAKVQHYIHTHSNALSENISTLRNDRVVILAKNSDKNTLGGIIHAQSASGLSAYVEPPILIELNNQVASLYEQEQEEIKRICFELSQAIKPHADVYLATLESLVILDGLFAKAKYGNQHQGICVSLDDSKSIRLINSRHPLIDPKTVVSNSYHLSHPKSMVLITGPNTGGKTVSLKVIGLSCLMAYSGIPVLATEASVPLFDQIFVDIGDDQSIFASLSTFSAHLSKLSHMLKASTQDSLVLLDELGGGTDPSEGESLAIAILEYLREKHILSFVTTHYSALKNYALDHEDVLMASVQFDLEALKPTYRYIEGLPGQSYALEIAKRYGIPEAILVNAESTRDVLKSETEKRLEELQKKSDALYQQELKLQNLQASLALKEEELLILEDKYKTHQSDLFAKAQSEIDAYVLEKAQAVDALMDELKENDQASLIEVKTQLKAQVSEAAQKSSSLESVKVGQWVRLISTHQVAQVTEVKKKRIIVSVSGLKMEVSLSDLMAGEAPKKEKRVELKSQAVVSVPHEINLIGLRVEEALPLLDHYLDDCLRARYPFCRVIHGHGTGTLRAAVHSFLDRYAHCEDYRLGQAGEGGQGATVVNFKGHKRG